MAIEALLFYGYDLGVPSKTGWNIEEADLGGHFEAPWMKGPDGTLNEDHADSMARALLAAKGVLVTSLTAVQATLAGHWGVLVLTYGSPEAPGYALAVAISVSRVQPGSLRFVVPTLGGTAHSLTAALEELGMEPLSTPGWIHTLNQR